MNSRRYMPISVSGQVPPTSTMEAAGCDYSGGCVRVGSIATKTSFPCHVRFATVSDQIADIA